MHQSSRMKKLNCGCQGNQFINGRIEHPANQYCHRWANALTPGCEQVLQCSLQVRVMPLGLKFHQVFNLMDLFLHRCKERGCSAQSADLHANN